MVLADGTSTLNISAEPSAPPQTNVDEEMVEKIKVAMSDRYVPENKGMKTVLLCKQWLLSASSTIFKFILTLICRVYSSALNLKAFHADPKFLGESCYVPLHRSPVMKKVTEIVGTNIPILEAIDLSENRLHGLDGVVSLLQKAPNTKLLYLARNKVLFSKRKILFKFFDRESH